MSHPEQMFFVRNLQVHLGEYFSGKKVLEIGSLDINGTVRDFFTGCDYTGIDVGEGKHVDIVCPGEDYGQPAASFDVVISCEAMEHNFAWRRTWLNILRLVKDDGLVIMTCATIGRRQHGTSEFKPCDSPLTLASNRSYYRNLEAHDFQALMNLDEWFSVWSFHVDHTSYDLYFFGLGKNADQKTRDAAQGLRAAFEQYYFNKNVLGVH